MSLKLHYNGEEGVLRSVGDPPNGILTIATGGLSDPDSFEVSFVIDPLFQPKVWSERPESNIEVEIKPRTREYDEKVSLITVQEAVDGLVDGRDGYALWQIGVTAFFPVLEFMRTNAETKYMRVCLEFAEELNAALDHRFIT